MMEGYETGDRVLCVGKDSYSWFYNITIGKIYTITKRESDSSFYMCDDVGSSWVYNNRDGYFISMIRHRNDVINNILK